MISTMDRTSIINLKLKGLSNRKISKVLGVNRNTVNKYWNDYEENVSLLETEDDPIKRLEIQEAIVSPPKYKTSKRGVKKRTPEFYQVLKQVLVEEEEKNKRLGWKKQSLTRVQIHEIMQEKGFDVSLTTVSTAITELRGVGQECFIKQTYDFGDRLEYDFGEVHLTIDDKLRKLYMAVLGSPASKFRWCYLYESCGKDVFLDSHVRFFEMVGGVWKEVVYDNMRNVVSKFLGKNEKQLNEDLVKLSIYYGFDINVTNAFSGNEKGFVENSVDFLRNKIFAKDTKFTSLDAAIAHMERKLDELNKDSQIATERKVLTPAKPPLELADICESKVSKYGFVRIDNNFYSVPEYLVDHKVLTKIYRDRIIIYSNGEHVCSHQRLHGRGEVSADIRHYLKTLTKKPGALRNSVALKSNKELFSLYNTYYTKNPKDFIAILNANADRTDREMIEAIQLAATKKQVRVVAFDKPINKMARASLSRYKNLIVRANQ